jgi:hypothetical protein
MNIAHLRTVSRTLPSEMLGSRAVPPMEELAVDLAANAMELNRRFYVDGR